MFLPSLVAQHLVKSAILIWKSYGSQVLFITYFLITGLSVEIK